MIQRDTWSTDDWKSRVLVKLEQTHSKDIGCYFKTTLKRWNMGTVKKETVGQFYQFGHLEQKSHWFITQVLSRVKGIGDYYNFMKHKTYFVHFYQHSQIS